MFTIQRLSAHADAVVTSLLPSDKAVRLGAISFVNTVPVYLAYTPELDCQLIYRVPSQLNRMILAGELDISPVSSVCYLQNQSQLQLLNNLSVSSYGSVESVLFLSRFPIHSKTLQESVIAVPDDSETSVQLLLHCLTQKKQTGCQPEWMLQSYEADCYEDALKRYGNALVIGDRALAIRTDPVCVEKLKGYYQYDLSTLWADENRLPFVFAVWVARKEWMQRYPERYEKINQDLIQSRRRFFETEALLAQGVQVKTDGFHFSESTLKRYYTECLNYELSEEHHQSLKHFKHILKSTITAPIQKGKSN